MDALLDLEIPKLTSQFFLNCGGKLLDLTEPQIMGILNVTPNSFSDGGHYNSFDAALFHAERMISEGAAIIDVGGESTKPGAEPISVEEELERVIPIIEALRDCPVPISIDTSKAEVMKAAMSAGASMINDVNALQDPAALEFAAQTHVPICLMHRQGTSQTMQDNPYYQDVVSEVIAFLQMRVEICLSKGIQKQRLILDPGFGFGKTLTHNIRLLKALKNFSDLGFPILVGMSKKNMIGALLNKPITNRLGGSLALAVWAVTQGVKILRVHDVDATKDALKMMRAIL
jgi:dihydropteroate synthase